MILGLFAVIESIITHQPKAEAGDSLSHQIRTKIPLLAKRFDDKIDYRNFFSISDENKIWKNLYDYRSRIAHGGKIHFPNQLKIKNSIFIVDFLRTVCKLLLRKAISEPQLCMDLREC
jgi:hypothetical protein